MIKLIVFINIFIAFNLLHSQDCLENKKFKEQFDSFVQQAEDHLKNIKEYTNYSLLDTMDRYIPISHWTFTNHWMGFYDDKEQLEYDIKYWKSWYNTNKCHNIGSMKFFNMSTQPLGTKEESIQVFKNIDNFDVAEGLFVYQGEFKKNHYRFEKHEYINDTSFKLMVYQVEGSNIRFNNSKQLINKYLLTENLFSIDTITCYKKTNTLFSNKYYFLIDKQLKLDSGKFIELSEPLSKKKNTNLYMLEPIKKGAENIFRFNNYSYFKEHNYLTYNYLDGYWITDYWFHNDDKYHLVYGISW